MKYKELLDYFSSEAIKIIGIVGTGEIIELFMRMFLKCHPEKSGPECNNYIARSNVLSVTTLSWIDVLIKALSMTSFCRNTFAPALWNNTTDVIKMWAFYLQANLAFYSEIYGEEKEMDDRWETPIIFSLTAMLALISNLDFRRYVYTLRYNDQPTGWGTKILDAFSGFFKGFAIGRSAVNTVEKVSDIYVKTTWAPSLGGRITRYVMGGIFGIASGAVAVKHSPEADIISSGTLKKTVSISNSVFVSSTFGAILIANMRSLEPKNKIGFGISFCLLIPAILISGYYKTQSLEIPPDLPLLLSPEKSNYELLGNEEETTTLPLYNATRSSALSRNVHSIWQRQTLPNDNQLTEGLSLKAY